MFLFNHDFRGRKMEGATEMLASSGDLADAVDNAGEGKPQGELLHLTV